MASAMTLALPRFAAFKGDNGRYLCLSPLNGQPYLRFVGEEISDPNVIMEIFVADGGNIRIKHTSSGKFWTLTNPNYNILADADDSSNANSLFQPLKVNSQSIALINLSNNHFCKRYTASNSLQHVFRANIDMTDFFSRLKVEEPVTKREISNIKYKLDEFRVYDNETVSLAQNSAINSDPKSNINLDLTFNYNDVKSNIWKTTLGLKLESKATFDVTSFPIIVNHGKVELLNQGQRGNELDETLITTAMKKVVGPVVVPPSTKVVVNLIATKGKCDVPFTFTKSDTLYNGESFKTEVEGNTYTVSNFYDFKFETTLEPIEA